MFLHLHCFQLSSANRKTRPSRTWRPQSLMTAEPTQASKGEERPQGRTTITTMTTMTASWRKVRLGSRMDAGRGEAQTGLRPILMSCAWLCSSVLARRRGVWCVFAPACGLGLLDWKAWIFHLWIPFSMSLRCYLESQREIYCLDHFLPQRHRLYSS